MQNNSKINTVLLVILIILVAVAIYFLATMKNSGGTSAVTPDTSVSTTTGTNNAPMQPATTSTGQTSSGTTNGGYSGTGSQTTTPPATSDTVAYTNPQLNFQLALPTGTPTPEINPQGNGDTDVFVNIPNATTGNMLDLINVSTGACPSGVMASTTSDGTVSSNGVLFTRGVGSGYDGGMEDGSVDGYYCAANNGKSYTFVFSSVYDRQESSAPSQTTTLANFEQLLASLNFQFTN